uniref:SH3 domain-containing protein n=1 Tax=Anopheles epiroticus TaxID=199890 RepID=A0A182PR82_9DIPT
MCDILAAISYGYGYHDRPRKRVKINMTIPSRPAPPPPQRNTAAPSRYTPTTDWDFCAFDSGVISTTSQRVTESGQFFQSQQNHQQNVKAKKPPPPRPPPPKLATAAAVPIAPLKKPGQPQSINILSSLFGHKRSSNGATASKSNSGATARQKQGQTSSGPVKLLPPPSSSTVKHAGKVTGYEPGHHSSNNYGSFFPIGNATSGSGAASSGATAEMQLISFDSPPSSPTFTQKSCSDCISVDSFSSDSNYSSPNNGNMSQAESGFEDDFVACGNTPRPRASSSVHWGELDPFEAGSASTSSGRATTAPSAIIYGTIPLATSATTAQIRTPLVNSKLQKSDFVDPLCNGQSVLPRHPTMSMPTIIKPPTSSNTSDSQKSIPSAAATLRNNFGTASKQMAPAPPTSRSHYTGMEDEFSSDVGGGFDSLPSQPMPSIPPPPLPITRETYAEEPYGIALYDFQGEADEDLSFKANEKIYLLKRLNEEWYMGRDKRGLEGMFPVNYVEVKVPLTNQQSIEVGTGSGDDVVKVRAMYNFQAQAPEDLTIMENDLVAVLYQITPEWLYGEIDGRKGQFPANYIEYVPLNLPQMQAEAVSNS